MKKLNKEYHRFWAAVSFYSRLPVPKHVDYSYSQHGEASKYLPVVGLIISTITALFFFATENFIHKSISLIFIFLLNALLSGLIHEDGLSDFLDGFGGGWNKEKILAIMKDSSVGAFGVSGLILLYGLKFALLLEIENNLIPIAIITSGVLSRSNAVSLMFDMNYARVEKSKSSGMVKRITIYELIFIIICGISPLMIIKNYLVSLIVLCLLIFRFWVKAYMNKWIQGYTGDCLGFVQQLSELVIYFGLLTMYNL